MHSFRQLSRSRPLRARAKNRLMHESLVEALHERRPAIKSRWSDLLHIERAATPLAHPDTLVHLLDETLDNIFEALRGHLVDDEPASLSAPAARPFCECGRNPFLHYYMAGERALLEALILTQAETRPCDAPTRDLAVLDLYLVVRRFARGDVSVFCSVCQYGAGRDAESPLVGAG